MVKDFLSGSIWSKCKSALDPHFIHLPPSALMAQCGVYAIVLPCTGACIHGICPDQS